MKRRHMGAVSICSLAVLTMAPAAAGAEVEAATLSACITSDQQIVKTAFGDTPASPCEANETEVRWMVQRALPEPTMNTEVVAGATLATQEVEPGVLRVVEDGDRVLRRVEDVVAGLDGSVWVFWNDRFARLGDQTTHRWSNDLFDTGQDSS